MSANAARGAGKLARLLPALEWLHGYSRADFSADVVAGLVTAILLVPQAMAYAMLAGLPPQVGLYASIAAPIAYAFLGGSRTLSVGPVSVSAIMVAAALAGTAIASQQSAVAAALVLAFEVGVILMIMATLRLGVMVNFLSHPVLSGFTSGAAILIILTQLPALLGITGIRNTSAEAVVLGLLQRLHAAQWLPLTLGVASLVLLALAGAPLRKFIARRSRAEWTTMLGRAGPLVVIVLAAGAVAILDPALAGGIETVGAIAPGLPAPTFVRVGLDVWLALLPSAALIALISYVESISIAKVLASRRRQKINPNQELAALGAANVAAAFTNGLPVAGGFGRTAVNFAAGARTQLASVVTALLIALTLLWFAPLFASLPKAALAAVIVVAVAPLIDVHGLRQLWRHQRSEALVFLLTLGAVLAIGIETGLVLGVLASLLIYVGRASRPHVAVVGRIPATEHFRNVQRHHVETWPHLALIRVDENLNFTNIGAVEDFLLTHLAHRPEVEHLVLVCSAINHIDASAAEAIERLIENLREAGVTVHLSEVKGPVMDQLKRIGLPARLSPGRIFFRTLEATEALGGARPV